MCFHFLFKWETIYFFLPETTQKLFFRQLAHTRQTLYSEHFGRTIKSVTAMVVVRHLHLEAERSAEAALSLLEDVGGGLVGLNHLNKNVSQESR